MTALGVMLVGIGAVVIWKTWYALYFKLTEKSNPFTYVALVILGACFIWAGMFCEFKVFGLLD